MSVPAGNKPEPLWNLCRKGETLPLYQDIGKDRRLFGAIVLSSCGDPAGAVTPSHALDTWAHFPASCATERTFPTMLSSITLGWPK